MSNSLPTRKTDDRAREDSLRSTTSTPRRWLVSLLIGIVLFSPLLLVLVLEAGLRLAGADFRFPAIREMILAQRGMDALRHPLSLSPGAEALNETEEGVRSRLHYPENLRLQMTNWLGVPPDVAQGRTFEVATNSLGFRESEFAVRKPPGTTRIVCVGDSMTFGWGVEREDTYPRLLARALAARHPDRSIEVLNLGVPGLTVTQIAELTRRDILSFEPDIAIVAFGMNDYRIGRWGKTTMATIENVRRLDPVWLRRYDWLLEKSDLARFLVTRRTRDYTAPKELLAVFAEQTSEYLAFLRARGIATIAFTEHAPWFPGAVAYAETFRDAARRNDVPCIELGPLLTASHDARQLARFESKVNWTSAFEDAGIRRADKARLMPGYNMFIDCGHLSRDGAEILVAALLPQVEAVLAHRDGTPPAARGA